MGAAKISRQNVKDAADPIRAAIAELEGRIDTIGSALLGTEEFARTANAASNIQLHLKKSMSDHMGRQLALFNMPSREDITAIGERLMSIEDRLVRVEGLLGRMAPAEKSSVPRPPRTKRPAARKPRN